MCALCASVATVYTVLLRQANNKPMLVLQQPGNNLNEHREYWYPIHTMATQRQQPPYHAAWSRYDFHVHNKRRGFWSRLRARWLRKLAATGSRAADVLAPHSTRQRTRLSRSWRWRHRYKRHLHCRRGRMTWQSHSQSTRRDTIQPRAHRK